MKLGNVILAATQNVNEFNLGKYFLDLLLDNLFTLILLLASVIALIIIIRKVKGKKMDVDKHKKY